MAGKHKTKSKVEKVLKKKENNWEIKRKKEIKRKYLSSKICPKDCSKQSTRPAKAGFSNC
jgi:hypothetical protein